MLWNESAEQYKLGKLNESSKKYRKNILVEKWRFSNICVWIRMLNWLKDPCFLYAHWQNKLLGGGGVDCHQTLAGWKLYAFGSNDKRTLQALRCNFIHFLVVTSLENLVFRQTSAFFLPVNVSKLEMERMDFHLSVVCCEWHCWNWLWVPVTSCLLN